MKENGRKKVLHTSTRMVLGGGVEKNIYYTIIGLQDEFEFHLSCGTDFTDELFKNIPGLKIILCPYLVNKISPIKDARALWFYYRLIKKEKYDIVHTHETKASFITKLAAWLAGCPYIIYGLHGVTFNDPMSSLKRKFYILLEKLTIRCSSRIISVGYDTIRAYHEENIGKHIPYDIVRSGINVDNYLEQTLRDENEKIQFRNSLGISKDDLVLINVGRFSFSKAQRYTIEAFNKLREKYKNLKLILIGEGELIEDCKQLARQYEIEETHIFFMGYQENVSKFLSISDIFMFTSLREGLPRVLVEASLVKVPVVTFAVEGADEILENNKTGFIVEQGNAAQFVSCTEELIQNPSLRKQFGESAFRHVRDTWDVGPMKSMLRRIYNINHN